MTNQRFLIKIIFLLSFLLLMDSCRVLSSYISVASGNYSFEQGAYQEANYRYLKALSGDFHQDYIAYNLGNVYHDLGIKEAALEQWDQVDHSEDQDLRFRVAFNKGVLYYGSGEYNLAFGEFRKALSIGPTHKKSASIKAAKRNLELSLQKLRLQSVGTAEVPGVGASVSRPALDAAGQALMDYVKQQERLNWEVRQDIDEIDLEDY